METTGIKTTIGQLAEALPALHRLAAQPLAPKTALHVRKLRRLVTEELQTAEFEQVRNAAIKELGIERPATAAEQAAGNGPTMFEVLPAKRPEFFARMVAHAAVETVIAWAPVSIGALGDAIDISANDLELLDGLIVE